MGEPEGGGLKSARQRQAQPSARKAREVVDAPTVIKGPKTLPSPRRGGFARLGSVKRIMGASDAEAALALLDQSDRKHTDALRLLGRAPLKLQ